MNQMVQFDNFDVKVDGNGRYSLNDLHKITGGKKNDGPSYWLQTAQAQKLISELVLTTGFPVVKKTEGRYGGTYAVKALAIAYAQWISAEFHLRVISVFDRFASADVTLAADIAERADPEKAEWLARRVQGVVARKQLTKTLASHGVSGGNGFRLCTNAIYLPLFKGTADEVREQRGLPEKANLREHMTAQELITTAFAEMLSADRVKSRAAFGNQQCATECNQAASDVAAMIRNAREAA